MDDLIATVTVSPVHVHVLFLTHYVLYRVPGTPDPSGFTVILDRDEFSKIRTRSNVLSEAEKKKRAAAAKEDKNTKLEAVQLRKQEMQHLEMTRKKNEKPSDLDQVNKNWI